jgi:type IV pilus assembly protein PilX
MSSRRLVTHVTRIHASIGNYRQQSGVVLIIGLVMLLLLTIIMLSAVQVTMLEGRMAANLHNDNIAFQAAESALREAEAFIDSGAIEFKPLRLSGDEDDVSAPFRKTGELICANGLCTRSGAIQPEKFPNVSEDHLRTAATGIAIIAREPQYIIELIYIEPDAVNSNRLYATFRISARAWGGNISSVVQLQSTYRLHVRSFVD